MARHWTPSRRCDARLPPTATASASASAALWELAGGVEHGFSRGLPRQERPLQGGGVED